MNKEEKLKIIDFAYTGNGVAKNSEGITSFVEFGIPGEEVIGLVKESKKNYQIVSIQELLKESKDRVEPKCEYFKICGGCNLQHISIEKQREFKFNTLKNTLSRQFKLNPIDGYILLGKDLPAYHYRVRVKLFLTKEGKIGFHKFNSKHVVEINNCQIVVPEINHIIKTFKDFIFPVNIKNVFIEKSVNGVSIFLKGATGKALKRVKNKFPDLNIVEDEVVNSFSQANHEANSILVEKVLSLITSKKVTELYAGSGNFSVPLAQKGVKVKAVELDESLVLVANNIINELNLKSNLTFVKSKAEDYILENRIKETLLLDPPRTGALEVVKQIDASDIKEVIYVSCNPATFGRDAVILVEKGFKLNKVFAVDMFPQTPHLECIGVFNK